MKHKGILIIPITQEGALIKYMSKTIEFIPSKGLYITYPVVGVIQKVVFDKDTYKATLRHPIGLDSPIKQINLLRKKGFKIYK